MGEACVVFFFKQKTAYEMLRSLVGSEMCIRDRFMATFEQVKTVRLRIHDPLGFINLVEAEELPATPANQTAYTITCLLYTSDAADDLLCVDLGGRRIIKKKNTTTMTPRCLASTDRHRHTPIPPLHHVPLHDYS